MDEPRSEHFALPEGWYFPDAEEGAHLMAELGRELPPGHLLYGVAVVVVAANSGNDDTLVRHLDEKERFTVVHLTWRGSTEINAQHPTVEYDGDFAGFVEHEATYERIPTGRDSDLTS